MIWFKLTVRSVSQYIGLVVLITNYRELRGRRRRVVEGSGGGDECNIVWCEPKYEKCDDDGVMLHAKCPHLMVIYYL